jgi:hypothetical protein
MGLAGCDSWRAVCRKPPGYDFGQLYAVFMRFSRQKWLKKRMDIAQRG